MASNYTLFLCVRGVSVPFCETNTKHFSHKLCFHITFQHMLFSQFCFFKIFLSFSSKVLQYVQINCWRASLLYCGIQQGLTENITAITKGNSHGEGRGSKALSILYTPSWRKTFFIQEFDTYVLQTSSFLSHISKEICIRDVDDWRFTRWEVYDLTVHR